MDWYKPILFAILLLYSFSLVAEPIKSTPSDLLGLTPGASGEVHDPSSDLDPPGAASMAVQPPAAVLPATVEAPVAVAAPVAPPTEGAAVGAPAAPLAPAAPVAPIAPIASNASAAAALLPPIAETSAPIEVPAQPVAPTYPVAPVAATPIFPPAASPAPAANPTQLLAPMQATAPAPILFPAAPSTYANPLPTPAPVFSQSMGGNDSAGVLPPAAEAAVILSRNRFYPSKIQMPRGTRVRIWFTTVESKPAALIVEGLKMQRWIASENNPMTQTNSPDYFELQRELARDRVTEIVLETSPGTYPFFDALSGARGEIVVE